MSSWHLCGLSRVSPACQGISLQYGECRWVDGAGILAVLPSMQKGAGRLVPFLKTSELCSRGWEVVSQPAAGAERALFAHRHCLRQARVG